MSEQTQTVALTAKKKIAAWVIGAAALVGLVIGASPELPQQTEPVAVAKKAGPCDAKKGQEPVPSRAKAVCVVVAAQPAWSTASQGSPKGSVLVSECRKAAWQEHLEWGRAHAQKYVVSCLVNEHAMWWKAQPKK